MEASRRVESCLSLQWRGPVSAQDPHGVLQCVAQVAQRLGSAFGGLAAKQARPVVPARAHGAWQSRGSLDRDGT
eukprot:9752201-Lingulodinium_polyedra.AAC.1